MIWKNFIIDTSNCSLYKFMYYHKNSTVESAKYADSIDEIKQSIDCLVKEEKNIKLIKVYEKYILNFTLKNKKNDLLYINHVETTADGLYVTFQTRIDYGDNTVVKTLSLKIDEFEKYELFDTKETVENIKQSIDNITT